MTCATAVLLAVAATGGPPAAAASPGLSLPAEPRGDTGGRVDLTGGVLHHFDDRPLYVATVEAGAGVRLSRRLDLLAALPLAMVERDGAVAAGWGNVAMALRF